MQLGPATSIYSDTPLFVLVILFLPFLFFSTVKMDVWNRVRSTSSLRVHRSFFNLILEAARSGVISRIRKFGKRSVYTEGGSRTDPVPNIHFYS